MRNLLVSLAALFVAACATQPVALQSAATASKPRVVVTTDPELDDANSLLRYLLYSADFETEGLVYASSGVHWKGDGATLVTKPPPEAARRNLNPCPCRSWRWADGERFIDDAVEAYAKAYPNLKAHDAGYPSPAELKARIRWGNVEFEGDFTKDSEGSQLIRSLLLDDRPGPVYLLAWGGGSTIARALKSIEEEYAATPLWPAIQAKVSRKAIIQSFGDQDGTYAAYIKPRWAQIEFRQMATQTFGYGARNAVQPQDQAYLGATWTRENVSSRGAMGALYRVWGDGKQMVAGDIFDYFGFRGLTTEQLRAQGYIVWTPVQEPGSWISEGDTSTFMNLVSNGLRGHEHASYGGWGGRGGVDVGPKGPDPQYASSRFFGAAQRDFAARLNWAVTPTFAAANHAPALSLEGGDRVVRAGESVSLAYWPSDPDGDRVSVRLWQYGEADSYPGAATIAQSGASGAARISIPADAKPGETIHIILEATDDRSLTSYRRVIYTVSADAR